MGGFEEAFAAAQKRYKKTFYTVILWYVRASAFAAKEK